MKKGEIIMCIGDGKSYVLRLKEDFQNDDTSISFDKIWEVYMQPIPSPEGLRVKKSIVPVGDLFFIGSGRFPVGNFVLCNLDKTSAWYKSLLADASGVTLLGN